MADILVVDDDVTTLRILHAVLTAAGHSSVCATDGLRALTILEDNPSIALLVTDVLMPKLDGRELIATLRRDPNRADLPVIIMSATVTVSEIVKLLEEGASRFLAKPVSPRRLLAEVRACLAPPTDLLDDVEPAGVLEL